MKSEYTESARIVKIPDTLSAFKHFAGRQIDVIWTGAASCKIHCPAHNDKTPSLSLTFKGGKTLVHCFAGCTQDAVLDALGWRVPNGNVVSLPGRQSWTYKTAAGASVEVYRPGPRGAKVGRNPAGVKGPYLPLLRNDNPKHAIVIVEGEKAADAVLQTGIPTACWIGGTKSVDKTDWSSLRGRIVILWPDNDDPGRKAMIQLGRKLVDLGCQLRMVDIPDGQPSGWDAADTDIETRKALIKAAGAWDPPEVPADDPVTYRSISGEGVESVDWLIPGWLPKDMITLFAGPAKQGKSSIACHLAALITRGGVWLDGSRIEQGRVLAYFGEDVIKNTVNPNLLAAGANLDLVDVVDTVPDGEGGRRGFDPALDVDKLHNLHPDTKLVIFDPIIMVAGNAKDAYRATDIRKAMAPVQELALSRNVAILGITHYLKRHNSKGSGVLDRIIGSQAWAAIARMIWVADNVDGQRNFIRGPNNIAESGGGWRYEIEGGCFLDPPYADIECRRAVFNDAVSGDADTIFADVSPDEANRKTEIGGAVDWLQQYFDVLTEPATWNDILKDGNAAGGFTKTTLRNARDRMRDNLASEIEYVDGKKRTVWRKRA